MKGYGWECDNCRERIVDALREPFLAGPNRPLPTGWLALCGPAMAPDSPEGWHVSERHFCSVECLALAAAAQIGAALSSAKDAP